MSYIVSFHDQCTWMMEVACKWLASVIVNSKSMGKRTVKCADSVK